MHFVNVTVPFKRVSFSPPEYRWHCQATFDELWQNAWDQPHQISFCVNVWFLKVGKSCVCDGDGVSCSQKWHTLAVNLRLTAGAKVYMAVLHLSYPCNSCLLLPRTHVRYTGSRRFRRSCRHRFSSSKFRVQRWTSFHNIRSLTEIGTQTVPGPNYRWHVSSSPYCTLWFCLSLFQYSFSCSWLSHEAMLRRSHPTISFSSSALRSQAVQTSPPSAASLILS